MEHAIKIMIENRDFFLAITILCSVIAQNCAFLMHFLANPDENLSQNFSHNFSEFLYNFITFSHFLYKLEFSENLYLFSEFFIYVNYEIS